MNERFLRMLRTAACLLLCLTMTGCAADRSFSSFATSATIPPAEEPGEAPVGMDRLARVTTAVLYLPAVGSDRLIAQYCEIKTEETTNGARALMDALLAYRGNGSVESLGGPIVLSLYGLNPVETAGGICTVSLSSSALQLEQERLYTACLAIAATLCQLSDVHSVNVLVADQAVGLDITMTLPMGLLTAHTGESLSVLWEQTDARRTPLGSDPSSVPLYSNAALYFPLADGTGFVSEARSISFSGQSPQQLVSGLLTALSAGTTYLEGVARMPDLTLLLASPPQVSDQESGGRLVTLSFADDFASRMSAAGVDLATLFSAVTYTITSFVPSVSAVRINVGGSAIRRIYNETYELMQPKNGTLHRSDFSRYLRETVSIYLSDGNRLVPVARTLPASEAASLSKLTGLLMQGATEEETEAGILSTLPAGLTEADILGMDEEDDTLSVNFSEHFANLIRSEAGGYEQMLCYSLVNTLCEARGLKRMRFWFGGETLETLGGPVTWSGDFLVAPGMKDDSKG